MNEEKYYYIIYIEHSDYVPMISFTLEAAVKIANQFKASRYDNVVIVKTVGGECESEEVLRFNGK